MREMILFSSQRIFFGLFLGLACAWLSPASAQISVSGWTKPAAPKTEATPSLTKLAERQEAPQIHRATNLKLESFKKYSLPAPTAQEMEQREKSKKLKIGITRNLPQALNVVAQSSTVATTEGEVKSLRIASEGAVQLRLHFARLELPAEAVLFLYAANNPKEFYGPYRSGTTPVWTPPISGSEAVIELFIPTAKDRAKAVTMRIEVDQVSHIFRHPQSANKAQTEDAESCNREVTAEWRETAKSVALIQFRQPDGEYLCSGVLLNDTKNSGTPYFLTANHCISNADTARGARFYWNFDQPGEPSTVNSTYSAQLLETSEVNDFTLLKITNPIPPGVRFSGWTAEKPAVGTAVTSIHHPAGDYKRISNGRTTALSCPPGVPAELCEFFHQVQWDSGITEPGSSGGGLWAGPASDPKLIGQLLGGNSSCTNPTAPDLYGRFDVAFEMIGSYLTGNSCAHSLSFRKQLVASAGTTAKVDVFANEVGNCPWTARSTADWIKLQNTQGQGDGTVSYTIEPNPSASKRYGFVFIAGIPLIILQRGTSDVCAPAQPIAWGQTINGNLESNPCFGSPNPRTSAVRYTFDVQPGQLFAATLKSSSFDAYLTLFGPQGEVIYENDDEYFPSTNARVPNYPYLPQMGVTRAGTYTLEVSSFDDGAIGAFTLQLEKGCTFQAKGVYQKYAADGVSLGAFNTRWFEIELETDASCNRDGVNMSLLSNTNWLGTNFGPASNYIYANISNHKGFFRFELPYNYGARTRRGLINIAGHLIPVEQAAFCQSASQLQLTPAATTYSGLRQSGSVQIKQLGNPSCTWEVQRSLPEWVTVTNYSEWGDRTNERVIQYQLQENKSSNSRQATLTIANQTHTIVQESYDKLCPALPLTIGQAVSGTLGSGDCPTTEAGFYVKRYSFRGYASQQVAYTLTSGTELMNFRVYSPGGALLVGVAASPEDGKLIRVPTTGYWDLPTDGVYAVEISTRHPLVAPTASYSFLVETLGGPNCVYQIDKGFTSVKPEGGSFVVNLTATDACPWTASSDVNWISFPTGATGTGNQTITVQATPNLERSRRAYVRIAGRQFEVYQDAPCTFMQLIDNSGNLLDAAYGRSPGGYLGMRFRTGYGCPLVVKNTIPWLKLDSTRDDVAAFTIEKNTGALRRGEIEVSGLKVQVVQGAGNLAVVSGADYSARIGQQGIVSIFGEQLAAEAQAATSLPLPSYLSDMSALVFDQQNATFYPQLFYVSPTQVNLLLPANMPPGEARVELYRGNGIMSSGTFVMTKVAPAIFSADASGSGLAAADVQRITASGESKYEKVTELDGTGKIVARAIDLGPDSERVFLLLYGIGTRLRSEVKNVSCEIDGQSYPVDYAGAQGYFAGVDQINVLLPKALRGKGEVTVRLKVDDQFSNAVKIKIAP